MTHLLRDVVKHSACSRSALQDGRRMMRSRRARQDDELAALQQRHIRSAAKLFHTGVASHTKCSLMAVGPVVHSSMHDATVGRRRLAACSERAVDQRYSATSVLLQQLPRHVDADNAGACHDKVESLHHAVHLPLTSAAFPEVGARARLAMQGLRSSAVVPLETCFVIVSTSSSS
jgi:hypothetical protein